MKREGKAIRALFFRQEGRAHFGDRDAASLQLIAPLLAESATGVAQWPAIAALGDAGRHVRPGVDGDGAVVGRRPTLFLNSAATGLSNKPNGCSAPPMARSSPPIRGRPNSCAKASAARHRSARCARRGCLPARLPRWRMAPGLCHVRQVADRRQYDALRHGDHHGPGKVDAPTSPARSTRLAAVRTAVPGPFLKSSSLCNAAEGCGLSEETARTYPSACAPSWASTSDGARRVISGLVLPLHAADSPALWER